MGGKFGVSAAIGAVAPPKPQMVEKQGWSYVSRPTQLVRGAHEVDTEVTSLCFSQVCTGKRRGLMLELYNQTKIA